MNSYCFVWQAWHFVVFYVCEVRDFREAEVAVLMGKVGKLCFFRRVIIYAYVVLRDRRGTF